MFFRSHIVFRNDDRVDIAVLRTNKTGHFDRSSQPYKDPELRE